MTFPRTNSGSKDEISRRKWTQGQRPGPRPTWSTRSSKTTWSSQTSQTSQTPWKRAVIAAAAMVFVIAGAGCTKRKPADDTSLKTRPPALIPEDKVRYHTCYSVNIGPRVTDMELKDFVDILLRIKAGAYSFEAANPRHDHEWEELKTFKIPDDKILIPGVIDSTTNFVEHPELVAPRRRRL